MPRGRVEDVTGRDGGKEKNRKGKRRRDKDEENQEDKRT